MAASHPALPLQALANSTLEYESLESEVSALHDELWEQLSLDLQVKEEASGQAGLPCALGPRLPFFRAFRDRTRNWNKVRAS